MPPRKKSGRRNTEICSLRWLTLRGGWGLTARRLSGKPMLVFPVGSLIWKTSAASAASPLPGCPSRSKTPSGRKRREGWGRRSKVEELRFTHLLVVHSNDMGNYNKAWEKKLEEAN